MKNKRRAGGILLAAVVMMALTACKPAFEYDEDAAIEVAKSVVDNINAGDFQAVEDEMTDDMKAALPASALQESVTPVLEESGPFVEFKDASTTGVTQNGVNYIVVALSCQYEKTARIYTISLTTDMKIGGLYVK